jgi:type VI secretion system Hcp family effector
MTLTAFLTMRVGGSILKGSSRFKDRDGQIVVTGVTHEVVTADPVPKHRSMVITKDIDRATPFLHQAFHGNVAFDECLLEFTRMPPMGGRMEVHADVRLTKARITSIRSFMPSCLHPVNHPLPEYEEVTLVYDEIEWTWRGKDTEDSDYGHKIKECDWSEDWPSWTDAFEAQVQSLMQDVGKSVGSAAAAALEKALQPKAPPAPEEPK